MALELPKARVKMRLLAAADAIAHWRLEDGGVTCVDAAGLSNLTSTATIVSGPHFGEAQNKGRSFTGANSASGTPTAGQRTALLGPITVQARFAKTELTTAGAIICCGSSSTDATEANNTLAQLHIRVGGGVTFAWETTGGADVLCDFAATIPAGEDVSVGVRRRLVGATYSADLFINGVLVETQTGKAAPVGGGSAVWRMANGLDAGLGAGFFIGTIYDVRIAALALPDEAIRESHSRAVRDWDLARCIASGHYTVVSRVLIRDVDGVWHDTTDLYDADYLGGYEDDEDVDDDGAGARITLRRRNEHDGVAPWLASTRINSADADGRLVDVARRVKIEEAFLPHGADRSLAGDVHWQLVFDGYGHAVDDGDVVRIDCRDRIYALQTAQVQPNRSASPVEDFAYASTPTAIETVLAAQLTDWRPKTIAGTVEDYAGGDGVVLHCPTSPAYNLNPFSVPATSSVAQAQIDLVDTNLQWILRFIFDESRQEFRYTLKDPGRSRTWTSTDPTITPDQILRFPRMSIDDTTIKNDIEVEFGDSTAADRVGHWGRSRVRVDDATSIGRYWRRWARIGQLTARETNNLTDATNIANNVLSDLAYPLADAEIEILPRRDIVLGDLVKLTAPTSNPHRHSADIVFTVTGIAHRRGRERSTRLRLRQAKPVSRIRRFLELFDLVGTIGGDGLNPPATPSAPTIAAIAGGLQISWAYPVNSGNRRYFETEIHVSAAGSSFTPSSATLKKISRGVPVETLELDPTLTWHVKIVHRDFMGNPSPASAAGTGTAPRFTPKAPHVSASRTTSNQTFNPPTPTTVIYNAEVGDPFGSYNATTGEWTQAKAGFVHVQASARYDSNAKPSSTASLRIYVNGVEVRTGPTATTNAGAAPNRATVELPHHMLYLAASDVLTVRIVADGNANSLVLNDALSWLLITTGVHA